MFSHFSNFRLQNLQNYLTHQALRLFYFMVKSIKNFTPYGIIQAGWVKQILVSLFVITRKDH